MPKLLQTEFMFDTHTVVFDHDIVLVFDRVSNLLSEIPNPRRKLGGSRLKPRPADALRAIKEAVPTPPKLVAPDEPRRKKTAHRPPTKLAVFKEQ